MVTDPRVCLYNYDLQTGILLVETTSGAHGPG